MLASVVIASRNTRQPRQNVPLRALATRLCVPSPLRAYPDLVGASLGYPRPSLSISLTHSLPLTYTPFRSNCHSTPFHSITYALLCAHGNHSTLSKSTACALFPMRWGGMYPQLFLLSLPLRPLPRALHLWVILAVVFKFQPSSFNPSYPFPQLLLSSRLARRRRNER